MGRPFIPLRILLMQSSCDTGEYTDTIAIPHACKGCSVCRALKGGTKYIREVQAEKPIVTSPTLCSRAH